MRFGRTLLLVLLIFGFFLLLQPAKSLPSKPTSQFNVTPSTLYLNWTNGRIANFTIDLNASTTAQGSITNPAYFVGRLSVNFTNSSYNGYSLRFNYTTDTGSGCGTSITCERFSVKSNNGTLVSIINVSNDGAGAYNKTNFTIIPQNLSLSVGRYYGYIIIANITPASTESVNVTIILDVPANIDNNTGFGLFNGTIPSSYNTYQGFFFNTSGFPNATGVYVNTSAQQSDIDLFLMDNAGSTKAKSINKTVSGVSESLLYSFAPDNSMWEIRWYGNNTTSSIGSVLGSIIFTSLNATNASDAYAPVTALNIGEKNVNSTSNITSINMTLKNEGGMVLSNVAESKEIYHVNTTTNAGANNFTLVVPDYATKIKVALNWSGGTNYSFGLYRPEGTLAIFSYNKSSYANASLANEEEYNETTNITKGVWRVDVRSGNGFADTYTLTVLRYFNASDWISTNFTNNSQTVTFNGTGKTNDTLRIQINITVPNTTLNGIYEGFVKYIDTRNAGIKIPIRVNATVPSLVVNNTFQSSVILIEENINTTYLFRTINITINNTGQLPINNIMYQNTTNLSFGSPSINFTINNFPRNLAAKASSLLNITLELDALKTNDTTGLYEGWIFVNTTNSSYPSRPYEGFNITLRINLTNVLKNVSVGSILSDDGLTKNFVDSSKPNVNVTAQYLNIRYSNGTKMVGTNIIFPGSDIVNNITSVFLYERNASYRIPTSGSLNKTALTTLEPNSGDYQFNITIPQNIPGGLYEVHTNVVTANGALSGESSDRVLTVLGEGYKFSSASSSISIDNSSSQTVTLNVYNYGPNSTATTLVFDKSNCPVTVAYSSCSGATGSCSNPNTTYVSFTSIAPYTNTNIYNASWTVTGSGSGSCTARIYGASKWFGNHSLSITVAATSSSTTTTSSSGATTVANVTTATTKTISITQAISDTEIEQGKSNNYTVKFKNTGNTDLTNVKASLDLPSSWWTSDAAVALATNQEKSSLVKILVPPAAEVKSYTVNLSVASSEGAVNSKTFMLKVTPQESNKTWVNSSIANLSSVATELSSLINKTKASGQNISADTENKLKQALDLIKSAQDYINKGDYFSASSLIPQIQSLLKQVNTTAAEARQKAEQQEQQLLVWIIGGVIALGAIGFVAYLFLPPKRSPPGALPGSPYEAQASGGKKGVLQKFKDLFKKKEKAVVQQIASEPSAI